MLGLNTATTYYSSPKQVGALTNWSTNFSSMYAYNWVAFPKTDGTLWAWGANNFGQLGLSNITYYSSPKQIGALTNWLNISTGYTHCFAVKTNGSIWAWGGNDFGQLGTGNTTYYSSPKQIGSLTTWLIASGGYKSSISLKY